MVPSQPPALFQHQRLPARAGSAERNAGRPQPLQFTVRRLIPNLLSSAVSAKVPGFAQSMCTLPPGPGHSYLKTASQICQDASVRYEYQEDSANQTSLVIKDRSLKSRSPDKHLQPGWLQEHTQAGSQAGLLPPGKRDSAPVASQSLH